MPLIDQFVQGKEPFPRKKLPELAQEVREEILNVVSKNGGHLASNLGVVELTIALLSIFKPQKDKIIWDVSHQSYAWKLLTDRKDQFHTLRTYGGLSGFTKRTESPCDPFGTGHAGTAMSAALGLATARDLNKTQERIIAIVGDASFSNGLSLEALNNISTTTKRMIVILNDNEMSISENVGALSRYFGRLLTSRRYNKLRYAIERISGTLHLGFLHKLYHSIKSTLKQALFPNIFVESFGFRYIGPIDGHDIRALLSALHSARDAKEPILIHIATKKGKGFKPAEDEPEKWHGVPPFDLQTATLPPPKHDFSAALGETLISLAKTDPRLIAITAAMRTGTGLATFAKAYPQRFFDVGMAEEHAATYAAGLAAGGYRPIVALYSTFAQRAIDNIFHDICLQNLPVCFCLDRAGIVGADGQTHHGLYDIPLLRTFPNITFIQPRNEHILHRALQTYLTTSSPFIIRYPRGAIPQDTTPAPPLPIGKAEIIYTPPTPPDTWIWALGDMLPYAQSYVASHPNQSIGIVDPIFIKPLDTTLLLSQARTSQIITIENGTTEGGFGSLILETLSSASISTPVKRIGFPSTIIPHGTPSELLTHFLK